MNGPEDDAFDCEALLVGITGAFAAVMMPHYVLFMRRSFAKNIVVMMSESAIKFVSPYVMRLCTGNWVFTDSFQIRSGISVPHIELSQWADLMVIMPATANILGKVAHGIGDDLISTTTLAATSPVVFAPSMNGTMWSNQCVQENVALLKQRGCHVIEPVEGPEITDLGTTQGVMPEPELIVQELRQVLSRLPASPDSEDL